MADQDFQIAILGLGADSPRSLLARESPGARSAGLLYGLFARDYHQLPE